MERYLSGGRSDSAHNTTLSFDNCMLRIPGSHNSKCVRANNGVLNEAKTEVKIIHEWDGHRPSIMLLIGSFHAYLVGQRLKQNQRNRQAAAKTKARVWFDNKGNNTKDNTVDREIVNYVYF